MAGIPDPSTAMQSTSLLNFTGAVPSSTPWGLPSDSGTSNGVNLPTSLPVVTSTNGGFVTTSPSSTSSTNLLNNVLGTSSTTTSTGGGVTNAAGVTNTPGILEFLVNGGLFVLGVVLVFGGFLKS